VYVVLELLEPRFGVRDDLNNLMTPAIVFFDCHEGGESLTPGSSFVGN
jgi:hypothetical protein